MSLSAVTFQLKQWADVSAAKAKRANDPDSIAALTKAEEQFRALLAATQAAEAEMAALRAAKPAKAATSRRKVTALEFWRRHGLAVDRIRAVYGDGWKCRAPLGETELVTVPACWRSFKTERGTTLQWGRDHRMPAAQYWADGLLPTGLAVTPDYARHVPGQEFKQDARWLREHGYEWYADQVSGRCDWYSAIFLRHERNHWDAIEAERIAKLQETQYSEAAD